MLTHPILALLRDVDHASINGLAHSTGADPRAIRIALLAATADDLVEVDPTFQAWRLTERGRSALGTATA